MAEGYSNTIKTFKVIDSSSKRSRMMVFRTYESFLNNCCEKFGITKDKEIVFVTADNEETEIDEEYLELMSDGSSIIIKTSTENNTNGNRKDATSKSNSDQNCLKNGKVISSLVDEMNVPFAEVDLIYTMFGEESLASVESFFQYKDHFEEKRNQRKSGCSSKKIHETGYGETSSAFAQNFADASDSVSDTPQLHPLQTTSTKNLKVAGVKDAEMWILPPDEKGGNVIVGDDKDAKKWMLAQNEKEIKEHISKYGLKGIAGVLQRQLDSWREKPLNIAVIGSSGKGKSSFINAIRNIPNNDSRAAKVGERECTKSCRRFEDPLYDNFVLWDVPGVGTESFPKETYMKDIQSDRYDFFMVITTERLLELDFWLGREIKKRGRNLYYIRTKVDVDMDSVMRRTPHGFNEESEFETLKKDLVQDIPTDLRQGTFHFFMVSSHFPTKYDFPKLLKTMLGNIPEEKKISVVFGVAGLSIDIIEQKASALRGRIWVCSLLSGAAGLLPALFVSNAIEYSVIVNEVMFYRQQFTLDDLSLAQWADLAGVSVEQLKTSVQFQTPEELSTASGITNYVSKYFARKVAGKVMQYAIPILGTVISGGMSLASTMAILESILQMMKEDALKIIVFVTATRTAM